MDYNKSLTFWENRGKDATLDQLNVTMMRERLPELARFIDRREKARLRRLFPLHKNMDVLDLGCGAGRMSVEFASRCRTVVAVDFSQALIDRGRALAEQHRAANIRWVTASALEFTTADRFDLIFLGGLLLCMADADALALLRRLSGMLKDTGRLVSRDSVLSDRETEPPPARPDYPVTYRRRQDYEQMFREAGFSVVHSGDLYAFPATAYAYDRLLPPRVKAARLPRAALAAALRLQAMADPVLLRLPRLNAALAGRRARIVQKITLCEKLKDP